MPISFTGPKDYEPINHDQLLLLSLAFERCGLHLSKKDLKDISDFFIPGANKLATLYSIERYRESLVQATSNVIERISLSDSADIDLHGGIKEFLRFLCPIPPFC